MKITHEQNAGELVIAEALDSSQKAWDEARAFAKQVTGTNDPEGLLFDAADQADDVGDGTWRHGDGTTVIVFTDSERMDLVTRFEDECEAFLE